MGNSDFYILASVLEKLIIARKLQEKRGGDTMTSESQQFRHCVCFIFLKFCFFLGGGGGRVIVRSYTVYE